MDVQIYPDKLEINGQFVRTYLVTDFPQATFVGVVDQLTHGEHKISGVTVNVAGHFKPSKLKFNKMMKYKLDRLEQNINASNDGKASSTARKEEVAARDALIYLRDKSNAYTDVWFSVTISSEDPELFKKACKRFKQLEFKGFKIVDLEYEQHNALTVASIGGGDGKIFERYHGRTMDLNAVGAFFMFLDGTVSDDKGVYIGHRLATGSAVYKDFTAGSDNQTMLIAGSSDSGKSTFLKGLVIGLLIMGFKVYLYDVDGEYFNLCKCVGGEWVDYTTGGKYVDPTIIERPILEELKSTDPESIMRAKEADAARWQEAVTNTKALASLLSTDFDIDRENALYKALMGMWEDAGIYEENPETWNSPQGEVGLNTLYFRIKAKKDAGSKLLAKDWWQYFEGPNKGMFKNAQSSDWIRNSQLNVFHVASSTETFNNKIGEINIVSITSMVWQQIKRDRILKSGFSMEIYDEWQRLGRKRVALEPIFRSVTTGRKFNTQVAIATNNPNSLFDSEVGAGLWENCKYKILFSLEENTIRKLANAANIPGVVLDSWLTLPKHSFIYRERQGGTDVYDILRMELPEYEIKVLAKTRGL